VGYTDERKENQAVKPAVWVGRKKEKKASVSIYGDTLIEGQDSE
jgi:hypothetical protein